MQHNEIQECDINLVWQELEKRIAPKGKIRDYWQGPEDTALYLYGESALEMRAQIADYLASYPLCKGARVITFASAESSGNHPGEASPQTQE